MPVAEKMENGCISPHTRWNVIGTILTAVITYVRHHPPHHIRPIPCSALHLVEVHDLPPVMSAIVRVFGCQPHTSVAAHSGGPASENLQGGKPRQGYGDGLRGLWGFERRG
jgi:hypothetical protein